jgi:tetratricopeptide (TPR) repeat protein
MTVSQAQRLIDGRSRRIDEIRYLKGLSELKLGRFNDARESFNYIISKYPNSKKVFDAQLGIGDSYMLAGDLDSAAGIYQGMLDKFRSNDNIQIIRSRLASCRNSPGLTAKTAVVQPRPAATVKAKAVPKVPEELDLIMATGELFSVQVGSFKNRSNADRLAQKLAAAGYESRVEIPVSPLDKLYRVKVGRISSRGEAEALSARLKAAGYSTKICDGETL